jgi:hypothetical protein
MVSGSSRLDGDWMIGRVGRGYKYRLRKVTSNS